MEARNVLPKQEISFDYLEMHQIKNTLDDRFLLYISLLFMAHFEVSLEGTLVELLLLLQLPIIETSYLIFSIHKIFIFKVF
jgi:hypothetical protein